MADRHILAVIRSSLSSGAMLSFCNYYGLIDLHPVLPGPDDSAIPPPGMVTIYQDHFDFACCRYPLSPFLIELLLYYGVHFYQVNPLGLCRPTHFEIACRGLGGVPTVSLFRCFYRLDKSGDWFTFSKRRKPNPFCALDIPDSRKGWKKKFFYVSEDFAALPRGSLGMTVKDPVPAEGSYDAHLFNLLKENPTPIVVYPEPLLVLAGLSTIRESPRTRPAVFKDGRWICFRCWKEIRRSLTGWNSLLTWTGIPLFPFILGRPRASLDPPRDPVVGDNTPPALEGVDASAFPVPPVHSPINQGSTGHFSYSAGKRPASEDAGPLPSKVRRLNVRFGVSRASGAGASALKAVPFQSIPVDSDDLSPHDSFDLDHVGFSGTNVITSPGEQPVDSSVNTGKDQGPIPAQDSEPFVPSWRLTKGSTFDDPVAVDEFLLRGRPPGERQRLRKVPGSELCEGFGYNLVQNVSHGVEAYNRLKWLEEKYLQVSEERDQFQARLDDQDTWVSSKMAPLEKDLESSRQAVGLMEERLKSQEVRHSDEITAHQVELDSHRVLLERAEVFYFLLLYFCFHNLLSGLNCESVFIFQEHARELERKVAEAEARATLLSREKEDHVRAVEGYEARLKALADNEKNNEERVASLRSEKKWLIGEGFRSLYSAILKSPGFVSLVGNVNMAAMAVGFNKGLIAGAAYAKKDVPLESHPEFDPDARQALRDRAETLQSSDHQLISQLAECSDKSIEEISNLIARYNASSS
ncbi:hypothetical protein QVD17_11864 [Tagetes erecta]|uniref:Transposase (putative) gypsy type domain-containing protein n=1 Tax=Tagetes erecta TaxID=13708 RepID=A0AAD8KU82_TARER|nr:hypothetical protein QVD17_11864 [Tagetes erecta]